MSRAFYGRSAVNVWKVTLGLRNVTLRKKTAVKREETAFRNAELVGIVLMNTDNWADSARQSL